MKRILATYVISNYTTIELNTLLLLCNFKISLSLFKGSSCAEGSTSIYDDCHNNTCIDGKLTLTPACNKQCDDVSYTTLSDIATILCLDVHN